MGYATHMRDEPMTAEVARPPRAGPPALHVAGLRKRFGSTDVLAGIDLRVSAGAAFGLVGANGAGKTTLIKCVLDFCAFDSGAIEIFGTRSGDPRARSRIAFVPERFVPPHYLRCVEFLQMMLALAGERFERARAERQLAELELDPAILDSPVRQLSKGMNQKLGLAACFMVARDLYLLDEPMSGLDPASRVAVKSVLSRLARDGRTLFFTSHVMADVEELCTELAVLDLGRVRYCGTPGELCALHAEPRLERAFIKCIHGEQSARRA